MTIRVCHMTSAHASNDSRIFQRECVSVAHDDRFEVYLIAPGDSCENKNVKIVGIGDKPFGRLKRIIKMPKLVYQKAKEIDADIYHFHDPELLGIGLKLKRCGKKVVFDSHESTVEQIKIKPYLPVWARMMISNIYDIYEKHVCRKLDAVIFPCLVDNKNPFTDKSKKTVFINNLPFISEFTGINGSEKKYDVCVIGSLTENRGITYLLEACKKASVKVALGGVFETPKYKFALEQKGLLDPEYVTYFGFCDRATVQKLYSQSKLCVSNILPLGQYPKAGNLPTKVYECMAMRLPIIISNFPYTVALNKKFNFGICVDPQNIDEISSAIMSILSDDEKYMQLGNNGRMAIENEFNWEKESLKLIQLYLELYDAR